jgi:hypothetical protein
VISLRGSVSSRQALLNKEENSPHPLFTTIPRHTGMNHGDVH